MRILLLLFFIAISSVSFAQDSVKKEKRKRLYLYWGWNTGFYTNSDIEFTSDNYNFELKKVGAKDRQTEFSFNKFLNPANVTIPQTNARIGYYINDKYDVSIGLDHMKYVVTAGQTVEINGEINAESQFDGVYNDDEIVLDPEFLTLEHTDGLNYVNTEFRRRDSIFRWPIKKSEITVNVVTGIGGGFLLPKTNTTVFGGERYDEFHLSGYGVSGLVGINIGFLKHFFFQTELKGGYINLPDIRISQDPRDRAKQQFGFLQHVVAFGGTIGF